MISTIDCDYCGADCGDKAIEIDGCAACSIECAHGLIDEMTDDDNDEGDEGDAR